MGAVNLGTSKVITLGFKPYIDVGIPYPDEPDDPYEDDQANVEAIITLYDFKFFTVKIKPGYYESFYIDIDYDLGDLEDFEEEEINAEINCLKRCLESCAAVGMQACTPGWVTTWFTYEDSVDMIETAINNLRNGVHKAIQEERNNETDVC